MPKIIALLNQKGGVGKTTIASNLAYGLHRDGGTVLLVDSDPQGSLRDWNEASGGEVLPVVGLDRETLANDLTAVKTGYDIIIIDGPPQVARLNAAAIKAADLVLIPVTPSPYDVWACADLVEIITARQQVTGGKPLARFAISRARKHTKLSEGVDEALKDYGIPLLASRTVHREIYAQTAAEGRTVYHAAHPEAVAEIEALKHEVLEVLNGL